VSESSLLELPAQAAAAGTARTHVRRVLLEWGLTELTDSVVLLVSEVVTNAILHAGSASSLCVERTDAGVRVSVTDSSPVMPAPRRRSSSAMTGRGCQLLNDLADSWGAEPYEGGKQVWFVVTNGRDAWAEFDADALLAEADL
jgi:anti-sigma regulatory factor (Ser/Thr protein kinase)